MDAVLDTAKRATAKALAKAGNLVMDELTEVECLTNYDRLSIKLSDPDAAVQACMGFMVANNKEFEPVPFSVRDERRGKRALFRLELRAGEGFVLLRDSDDQPLMRIALPEQNSRAVLCKVQQPCGATIYKVSTADSTGRMRVYKTTAGSGNKSMLQLEKFALWYLFVPKLVKVAFANHGFRAVKDGQTLGRFLPKFKSITQNAMFVKFGASADDQTRAVLLATAAVQLLMLAHHELYNLLKISCTDEQL